MVIWKFRTDTMGTIPMRMRIAESPGEELDGDYYAPRDIKFNNACQAGAIVKKFNALKTINPDVQFVEAWTERPDGARVDTVHTIEGLQALAVWPPVTV